MVDCYADWPSIQLMNQNPTTHSLTSALRDYFARTAVPDVLWSDGGPQFRSHQFAEFLQGWGVEHKMSSPRYPQSNGKAEATVKSMKKLIKRATKRSGVIDQYQLARSLLQYRNTPSRKDNVSPAQELYGHPVQDTLPVHYRAFAPEWQAKMKDVDARRAKSLEQSKAHYNKHAKPLPVITTGSHVAIRNNETNCFDIYGIVMSVDRFRKYTIKTASGRFLVRNRRFIRKRIPASLTLPESENPYNVVTEENVRPLRNVGRPVRLVEDNNWP